MTIIAGVVGLFVIIVMVGLVGPSIPIDAPGARSSDIAFTAGAIDGRRVYETTGCAACHTQMVRPVVADVGLGPVTLDDTDQVLGIRRFGPDLADVGSRLAASQIEATIDGLGEHPAHNLGSDDMESLVTSLVESSTSSPDEAES
jgi:cbb3-type cytochrome oxidase cytochrome c subunit